MMETAIDWRGALEVLTTEAKEAQGYIEEGDTKAAKGCVARVLGIDHAVLRLSHCPDMAPVYGSLDTLGMTNGCSSKMAKLKMKIRTLRAERKAGGQTGRHAYEGLDADEEDVPHGVVVPPGYAVTERGVHEVETDTWVTLAPMLLTGIYRDVLTGTTCVRLSWVVDGEWVHHVVPRKHASDVRAIVALSDLDAPVNSTNAAAVVRFLAAQQAYSPDLPRSLSTARQGWHGKDGELGFVLGEHGIGSDTTELELRVPAGGESGPALVAKGLHASGTLEQWREAVSPMAQTPRSLIGLGASAAAPLLGVIPGARSFVLDVYNETSSGKSTAARAWASVWGKWSDIELAWMSSDNAMAKMGAFLCHLPTFVDDTKNTEDKPDRVPRWIYDITSTRQRAIGNPNSFKLGAETHTIGIVTGERSATTIGTRAHGGAIARVLSVGGIQCHSAEMAVRLEADVSQFYGTAGRALIAHLVNERKGDGWESIRVSYGKLLSKYTATLTEQASPEVAGIAARGAPYLALVHTGLRLLKEAGCVDFTRAVMAKAMAEAVACSLKGLGSADLPREALRHLIQEVRAHYDRMYVAGGGVLPPSSGWWGRVDDDGTMHVRTGAAKKIVEDQYDWPTVYAAWRSRGYLLGYPRKDGGSEPSRTQVLGHSKRAVKVRCYTITPKAIAIANEA